MQFSGVLFDLDGTLLNTLPDLANAANAMRQDMGFEPIDDAIIGSYIGKGIENMVIRVLGHDGQPAAVDTVMRGIARFKDHYHALNGQKTVIYPYVIDGLEKFRQYGLKLAVVTNKGSEFTHTLLNHTGLTKYFDAVVCGDTCDRKKPDPMPLFYACDQLQIKPSQALFIGDSVNDVSAANAANIPVLVLPYGYNEGKTVQNLPASAIVESILDAADWAATYSLDTQQRL